VNSTLACSIVAKKLHIPVAHVEAGLRSGDRRMPEEINRIVTDSISDLFFVTEPAGVENLLHEGQPADCVHHVGNVMIDNLLYQRDRLAVFDVHAFPTNELKARLGRYGVLTLHRPSNVEDAATFCRIGEALRELSKELPLIFPAHPRTRDAIGRFGIDLGPDVHLTGPLPYMEFLNLWKDAVLVLTDSGGLQEETMVLGVPCLTLRDNTERPITAEMGCNRVVGTKAEVILSEARKVFLVGRGPCNCPALWDGHAADRIVDVLRGWDKW
jgi:UDP-N-acetylglucosamine 2-epimerase (non-hydrolysing)